MDKSQQQLDTLVGHARAAVDSLTRHFSSGSHPPEKFTDSLFSLLENSHATATAIGRHRAGDETPLDPDDRGFANLVMREENEFLASFEDDLAGDRYRNEDGTWKEAAIRARAQMYVTKVKATANEAWALTTDGPIRWILGEPETEHCQDCPDLAARGPYTALTLPTYPRACQTTCLTSCLCTLQAEDGSTSFD